MQANGNHNYNSISVPSKGPNGDERFFSVDAIRAYAIVMVLLLHTSAGPMKEFSNLNPSWWWISNLLFSFAHQGVPLFIMISGMLLLNPVKRESLSVFFKKRFNKVVIPFLFWGIIYFCWLVFYKGERYTATEALDLFIKGPIYYHLWFIYLILGLYLATPILRVYLVSADIKNLIYFVGMWFLFVGIFPVISHVTHIRIGIHTFLFTGYIGYFILGYLISRADFSIKYTWLLGLIIISATLFTAVGTYVLAIRDDGVYHGFFVQGTRPNIIVMTVCMFLLLSRFQYGERFKHGRIEYIAVRHIALISFGIYLLHPIILELLDSGHFGFRLNAMSIHPLIGIPSTTIVTLGLCVLVVTLLRKITLIKILVP